MKTSNPINRVRRHVLDHGGAVDHQKTMGVKFLTGDARLAFAIRAAEKQIEFEDAQGQPKQLVADGVWQVPPEKRPHGWEKMGVKEA